MASNHWTCDSINEVTKPFHEIHSPRRSFRGIDRLSRFRNKKYLYHDDAGVYVLFKKWHYFPLRPFPTWKKTVSLEKIPCFASKESLFCMSKSLFCIKFEQSLSIIFVIELILTNNHQNNWFGKVLFKKKNWSSNIFDTSYDVITIEHSTVRAVHICFLIVKISQQSFFNDFLNFYDVIEYVLDYSDQAHQFEISTIQTGQQLFFF